MHIPCPTNLGLRGSLKGGKDGTHFGTADMYVVLMVFTPLLRPDDGKISTSNNTTSPTYLVGCWHTPLLLCNAVVSVFAVRPRGPDRCRYTRGSRSERGTRIPC